MSRASSVDVSDLIGTPWARMRCGELAHLVLTERIGLPVPAHALGVSLTDPVNARKAVEYLERGGAWELISERSWGASRLGDLLVWPGSTAPHVGVLVHEISRHVLTTAHPGGAFSIRSTALPFVGGKVYRWRGL